MTTATIALTELAEKGADIDVLRQMVHVWTRRPLQAPIDSEKVCTHVSGSLGGQLFSRPQP